MFQNPPSGEKENATEMPQGCQKRPTLRAQAEEHCEWRKVLIGSYLQK
jgi:hypothetical protein